MSAGIAQEPWTGRGMWVYAFEAWTEFIDIGTSTTGAKFRIDHIVPAPLPGTPTKRGPKK